MGISDIGTALFGRWIEGPGFVVSRRDTAFTRTPYSHVHCYVASCQIPGDEKEEEEPEDDTCGDVDQMWLSCVVWGDG